MFLINVYAILSIVINFILSIIFGFSCLILLENFRKKNYSYLIIGLAIFSIVYLLKGVFSFLVLFNTPYWIFVNLLESLGMIFVILSIIAY